MNSNKVDSAVIVDLLDLVEIQMVNDDNFLQIAETLTRMGIANKYNKLYQSCHLFHKRGHYYIVHFKELFMLDGNGSNFSENDKLRRNKIASLLEDWNLIKILVPEKFKIDSSVRINNLTILKYEDVQDNKWELIPKYNIGKKHV